MEIVVKRKRAAAYCRVSTGMECQEGSYEIQKSYFTELLSNNPDEELVKVYADEGSGRSTQRRPEFRQMIQDCVDGKIDVIYTKSISRFSRNMLDCVTVVRQLKELGIPVIFEKEGINTMDGQSELFFHILAIIAEEESKSIGENVRAGIAYLHDQGIPTGRVTYGFRRVSRVNGELKNPRPAVSAMPLTKRQKESATQISELAWIRWRMRKIPVCHGLRIEIGYPIC